MSQFEQIGELRHEFWNGIEPRHSSLNLPEYYYWIYRVRDTGNLLYGLTQRPNPYDCELIAQFDNASDAQAYCDANK